MAQFIVIRCLTAVKREKFAKVKQRYFKVKFSIFTVLSLIYYQDTVNLPNVNILPIHCQFTKRFESLPKKFLAFENYKLQNCRRHLPT